MKKFIFVLAFFPLFVIANAHNQKLMKFDSSAFKDGALAAAHCHTYYILDEQIFDLKINGDPKKMLFKFKEELGEEHVNQIFKFNQDRKIFLNKNYEDCLKKTIATGKIQKL